MNDEEKTKEQLIMELGKMRERVAVLVKELFADAVVVIAYHNRDRAIQSVREIASLPSKPRVVVVSGFRDASFETEVLKAGAAGFVMEESALGKALLAIRNVVETSDRMYFDPGVTRAGSYVVSDRQGGQTGFALASLSPREIEVFKLIAEGKSTKEIACLMKLSVKTVEAHRRKVMEKLGMRNIADLVRHAIREGLVPVG